MFFCIFVSDGDFAGGEGEQGRLASVAGIFADGEGGARDGCLASVCFYLVLRRVWQYTNIGGLRNDKMLMG